MHEHSIEPAHLAKLERFPANPAARALVERLRAEIITIFGRMDAVHFQVGRAYPLKDRSDPVAWSLIEAIKAAVDPHGRMNPGVIGL